MQELSSSTQVLSPTSVLKELSFNTMATPVGILRNASHTQQSKPITVIAPFSDTSDSEQEGVNPGEYGHGYETEPEGDLDPGEAQGALQHENTIKAGYLAKKQERKVRGKNWKRRWFVLRSTKLAYYKSEKEYELLRILDLNDIHAVAEVKLKNRTNVFGIVTPKRTYYVQANNKKELDEWVDAINKVKKEVQDCDLLEEEEDGSQADSEDIVAKKGKASLDKRMTQFDPRKPAKVKSSLPSAPVLDKPPINRTPAIDIPNPPFRSTEYGEGGHSYASASSYTSTGSIHNAPSSPSSPTAGNFINERKDSSSSEEDDTGEDNADEGDARDIHKGYLYKLDRYKKTWKKRWFVLKNTKLAYYKDLQDHRPHLNINLSDILDAIEIDPVSKSKSKNYCFKIITPKRTYICCALSEESQVAWLAALQVALVKTKEKLK